jgi:hypothetical protein
MARDVALSCRELRCDPPEWITALSLDVDCPCPGGPHRKVGTDEAAATAWTNPANGMLTPTTRSSGLDPAALV